ncbi:MAG: type II secretion system protein [Akkermansiaceae bacterium]|nr:type II secretion system protein [Akkermansiaceae bacterium]
MKSTVPRSRRTGFTLVELLVVIAIIIVLASMGFGAGMVAINKARKAQAKNDCVNLVNAVAGYFDDYSHLPDVPAAGSGNGALTDSAVMNILIGFDKEKNPKQVRYFQGKQSSSSSAARAFGGLFYESSGNSVQLFDPWKKDEGAIRHYYLLLDLDYDEEIQDPTEGTYKLYGRNCGAWSSGQDGQVGSTKNRDNVYSWK